MIPLKNANILIIHDQDVNIEVQGGFPEMQGYAQIKTKTDPIGNSNEGVSRPKKVGKTCPCTPDMI